MGTRTDDHVRAKCIHPSRRFIEFPKTDLEKSIPERFEHIVRLYPRRIAVKTRIQQLTYIQLNDAANRLANILLARLGTSQEPIGLCLPKGIPLIIAIFGTLKAGKICVPIDPTLPQSRISHMLENAQVRLMVTNTDHIPLVKALGQPNQWLNIDDLTYGAEPINPGIAVGPDDFAYIFYTSGSTGLPKGVSENHQNLLFHVMAETNEYHLCPEDRVIFVAASGRDILRALLNGACVYPFDVKREGLAQLASWLLQEEITIFSGVVSLFRHFVATLDGTEKFRHLRLIKLIGEAVHRQDVDLYRKYFSDDCILINSYGPNEAGHVAHYFIDKETNFISNSVPVGYTVAGKDILLLDGEGREADTGTVAEIVVRSRYLSPGYWRRADLTEARFRRVSIDGPERLYFTGDLGVRDADGCLTVTGREDFQVKIRGNRVEISEIEGALLDLESVKEAVVVTRENASGDRQLVAYFVAKTQPVPTATMLRKRLAETLPEYMVPSVFVSLDALPMTGIGKVNRRALPDPGYSRPDLDTPFAGPRVRVEEVLAQIWAEVLSLDKVGIHDNFFDLGGHSLAATRIITKVIGHFNREISLRRLFDSPTVAQMAAVIANDQGRQLSSDELENILTEIEALSPEEAQQLLSEANPRNSKS